MKGFDLIIVAAGKGKRFGCPKQFVPIFGRPLLTFTILKFLPITDINRVILVLPPECFECGGKCPDFSNLDPRILTAKGGTERTDSVANGLRLVESEFVLVHDGARPLVSQKLINNVMNALKTGMKAVVPAIPVRDTMKKLADSGEVEGIVERKGVMQIQTPQGFKSKLLKKAYEKANAQSLKATDDSTLVELTLGIRSKIVEGDPVNLKITYPEDLEFLKRNLFNELLVGHGYDFHRLRSGRRFVLGGVHFEDVNFGPLGHSDGDALIHAIIDALISPCGLGDIGKLFPDTDPRFKDISSVELLRKVSDTLTKAGCVPLNIDATVILERPKIGSKTEEMRRIIAETLNISSQKITIKGKTAEGLGPVGEGKAVEVHVVALIGKAI